MCLLLVVSIQNILNIAHKSAPEETEMDCPFPELECIVRRLSALNTLLKMSGTQDRCQSVSVLGINIFELSTYFRSGRFN